jgi:hemerythrin-like domain-containing protein
MNDPVAIIKNDHRAVEELFREFETAGEDAVSTKHAIALDICEELTKHAEMEESLWYPKIQDALGRDDALIPEALAEHEVAKSLIAEIEAMDEGNPNLEAKITVLKEAIEHHVAEEETEMLPRAEDALSEEDLAAIGDEMDNHKRKESEVLMEI